MQGRKRFSLPSSLSFVIAVLGLTACNESSKAPAPTTVTAATAAATASATTPANAAPTMATASPPAAPPAPAAPAAALPVCKAPEIVLYPEANRPVCLRPCNAKAHCPADQTCTGTAMRVAEGVGTARDVVDVCEAKGASSKKLTGTAKVLDTSDWKGAPPGSPLELRWTVDEASAKPPLVKGKTDDLTKHAVPLELTLTIAGHAHTVALETNGAPPFSDACAGVSFFWAGKNVSFQLAHAEGGRAVLTRTETSESAPAKSTQLYVFDVPAGTAVAQELVTLGADGRRGSKKCTAPTLP